MENSKGTRSGHSDRGGVRLDRVRIHWIAISIPALLIGAFEFLRHDLLEHRFPGHTGNIIGALIVAGGVSIFIRYYAALVARVERDLGRSRAEAAVLAERHRIAREMHDRTAQALFHLRVRLQDLDRHANQGNVAAIRAEIGLLQGQITDVYEQSRSVIADPHRLMVMDDGHGFEPGQASGEGFGPWSRGNGWTTFGVSPEETGPCPGRRPIASWLSLPHSGPRRSLRPPG